MASTDVPVEEWRSLSRKKDLRVEEVRRWREDVAEPVGEEYPPSFELEVSYRTPAHLAAIIGRLEFILKNRLRPAVESLRVELT